MQESAGDKCPWEIVTGHWKVRDDNGLEGEVRWSFMEGSEAIRGDWVFADGSTSTEVMGWQANRQMIASNAFGTKGSFWEIEAVNVTEDTIEGHLIMRDPLGNNFEGMFQVRKQSERLMSRLYTGFDDDGEAVTVKGVFERID